MIYMNRPNQPVVLFLHGFGEARNWAKYDIFVELVLFMAYI